MIKAIIFDLDDTLYDETQFVKGGFKAVASYIAKNYNMDNRKLYFLLLSILKKQGRGQTFDIALKELELYDKKLIQTLVEVYRAHPPKLLPYYDTITVLSSLKNKGYKLGLITDGNTNVQRNKVEALKIKHFFDCAIFSNEYGDDKQKPNLFSYNKAIKELNVSAEEVIYVGDNPHKDFVNSKKLGIKTVRILRGMYKQTIVSKEYDAEYKIINLTDLLKILQ